MSAASWPAANPSGDNVDLEDFGTVVDVDQFFAEPPSAEGGVVNPSVVPRPLTIFNPSIAQPTPAVTEPSMPACPIMECEAMQQDATRALCNEHTQFAARNSGVAKAPAALHPRLARGGGNLAQQGVRQSVLCANRRTRCPPVCAEGELRKGHRDFEAVYRCSAKRGQEARRGRAASAPRSRGAHPYGFVQRDRAEDLRAQERKQGFWSAAMQSGNAFQHRQEGKCEDLDVRPQRMESHGISPHQGWRRQGWQAHDRPSVENS
eukprot:Tamp_21584.p1 GENE.Tamp_21584~~Tamp_21584.p1  ORF type:complete len:295 (+),score=17.76 Tamp_21584:98-886(+)